mmetsp:Transcript_7933/g.17592  ORF Transcript_7933/g.17592 Transcript_7933/m.17592 type:complete len:125 (+) Transcript_7933:113-487(+)
MKVVMVSSLDETHPADNIMDGRDQTFWMSTGLYPQEILLQLPEPTRLSSIQLSTTNVKTVRVEGCSEDEPVNFKTLADGDLDAKDGRLQIKDIPLGDAPDLRFVKVQILSGWHDFCSVHKILPS